MSVHHQLVRLRKRILSRLSRSVRDRIGEPSTELRRYERRYRREIATAYEPVTPDEVLARAVGADIVYCGDYHTFRPAQQTCLRLLEAMTETAERVTLLVELALSDHQRHLDRYLDGRLPEADLLRRLDYGRTWGFSWAGYRPILEYAREHGVPVVGINGPGTAASATLEERDAWAARVVARAARAEPRSRLLVLAGDLHVAQPHLPRAVERELGAVPRQVRIYQNSDDLYWSLAKQGLELEAVRLGADVYCVFNGTPWAKLESYVTWLEQGDDEAVQGLSGEGCLDYTDRIVELTRLLARFLGIAAPGAEGFAVYTADDLSFVPEMRRRPRTAALLPHVLASDVFLVPGPNLVYLARLDLGHAAEAAAEILLQIAAPAARGEKLEGEAAFFRRACRRALTYCGAKMLNPVRRHPGPEVPNPKAAPLVAAYRRLILGALADGGPRPIPPAAWEDDLRLGLEVSRAVGRACGERLYQSLRCGRITLADVRELYRTGPGSSRAALADLTAVGATATEPVAASVA